MSSYAGGGSSYGAAELLWRGGRGGGLRTAPWLACSLVDMVAAAAG